ncbi:MAG: hypothetical protein OER56_17250, partial [Hyphomicrobiales bacterium]|nr:hypothetical protein [Hyphomicrobiales bacterium]
LNNVADDLWTLLWFGLLGFFMRQFGFPLAPMILGVVLGNIAEINLARAMAISTDVSLFVTRPWSLFFLIVALFSAAFPHFQQSLAEGRRWVRYYVPAMLTCVALPLMMMGSIVRPVLALICIATAGYLLYRSRRPAKSPTP